MNVASLVQRRVESVLPSASCQEAARRKCRLPSNHIQVEHRGDVSTLRPGLFGVVGRFRLTRDGQIVVPDGSGSHFLRHPRTIAGTTSDGKIMLVTIDGRQTSNRAEIMAAVYALEAFLKCCEYIFPLTLHFILFSISTCLLIIMHGFYGILTFP